MEVKNNNAVPKQGAINVFISTLGISHAANGEFLPLIVQQFQMYQKMLAIDCCLTETRQLRFPNTARGKEIPFIQDNPNIFSAAVTCHLARSGISQCHF